jgi:hypothetical protein
MVGSSHSQFRVGSGHIGQNFLMCHGHEARLWNSSSCMSLIEGAELIQMVQYSIPAKLPLFVKLIVVSKTPVVSQTNPLLATWTEVEPSNLPRTHQNTYSTGDRSSFYKHFYFFTSLDTPRLLLTAMHRQISDDLASHSSTNTRVSSLEDDMTRERIRCIPPLSSPLYKEAQRIRDNNLRVALVKNSL